MINSSLDVHSLRDEKEMRIFLMMQILIYPTWAFVVQLIDPSLYDSFLERLAFCTFSMGTLFLSYKMHLNKRHFESLYLVGSSIVVCHLTYLTQLNNLNYVFVFGSLIAVFLISLGFQTLKKGLLFYGINLLYATYFLKGGGTHMSKGFFLALIATAGVVFLVMITFKNKFLNLLKKSDQDTRDIIQHLPIAGLSFNTEGVWVNNQAKEMLGPGVEKVTCLKEFFFLVGAINSFEKYMGLMESNEKAELDLSFYNYEDKKFEVTITGHSMDNRNLLMIVDNTEKIAGQKQLAHSLKMASLGQMTSGMAHEFNNPLAVVKMSMNKLKKALIDSTEHSRELFRIEKMVDRMASLITSLKEFTASNELSDQREMDVSAIVEEVSGLFNERLKRHNIDLEVESGCGSKTLVRRNDFHQVLMNLLGNSYTQIKKNKSESSKWIKIDTFKSHGQLGIRVTDSGRGIDKDVAKKMFNPFFTTNSKAGLGLGTVQNIIESYGGKIKYELNEGHTSFVVLLEENSSHKKVS